MIRYNILYNIDYIYNHVNVYVIMKTMCPPGYYHNGFMAHSCTWAHDVQLHIAGTNEPKSAQQAKQGA